MSFWVGFEKRSMTDENKKKWGNIAKVVGGTALTAVAAKTLHSAHKSAKALKASRAKTSHMEQYSAGYDKAKPAFDKDIANKHSQLAAQRKEIEDMKARGDKAIDNIRSLSKDIQKDPKGFNAAEIKRRMEEIK